MAYVANSSNVIDQIRRRISSMANTEINALTVPELKLDANDCDAIEAWVWGENLPLMDKIPDHWLRDAQQIDVQFRRLSNNDINDPTPAIAESLTVTAPRKIRIPPKSRASQGFRLNEGYSTQSLTIDASLLPPEKTAPIFDAYSLRTEAHVRWMNVRRQVINFLEGAKSLNEALKLWPQLEIYVPSVLMDKVMEKKTAAKTISKAAEILKQIDTEQALASAALARMAQSQAA